uniref:Alpha-1-antitrypsin-like n=1 Tax=Pogona vitticeps TaxID=103695 RepID=A0ABM5FBD3_9SAUR
MSNFYLCLLLLGICGFAYNHHVPGHHGEDADHHHHPTEAPDYLSYQKISRSNANFAFKFFHQIVSEAGDENVFFSPLSLSTAFAFLSLGAKSTTLNQILTGLGFNETEISEQEIHDGFRYLLQMLNRPKAELELNIGNALFTHDQVHLLEKFVKDAKHCYQAEIFPANFTNPSEVEKQINSYIENKTHIKDAIKGLRPDSVMVLVNQVFLKAYWQNPFNSQATREAHFFVDKKTMVKVPMMHKDAYFKTYRDADLSCEVVELPYKGGASALFILPDQGKLKHVEQALGKDLLFKWKNSLHGGRVELFLPRFSISGSYDVKNTLQKMGITDVFEDRADLSGMTGKPNLKVSKAIHKTYLNVHENDTEAAVATLLEMIQTSRPIVIRFNRPFLQVITFDNDVLLLGEVQDPTKN